MAYSHDQFFCPAISEYCDCFLDRFQEGYFLRLTLCKSHHVLYSRHIGMMSLHCAIGAKKQNKSTHMRENISLNELQRES